MKPTVPNKFQWLNITILATAHMLHDVFSSFYAPLLPLLIDKLHFSYTTAGTLSVLQKLPNILFSPFIGFFADYFKLRYFLIIAPAITTTTMCLLGLAPNIVALASLLFVMGISSTIFHIPAPVMVRKASGDKVGRGMSFYMLGGEIARSLGPILILSAATWWGLEGTYRLIPIGWLASIFLYIKIREIPIHINPKKKKEQNAQDTLKKFFSFFIILFFIMLNRGFLKAAMTTFLPVYLTTKGTSIWVAGLALSLIQIAGVIGTIFAGTLSDYIGRIKTILAFSIFTPIFMGLFLITKGLWLIPILCCLGICMFATIPVILAIIHDQKTDRPSFINGIYATINFAASAISTFIVGVFADKFGIAYAYPITMVISIIAIPFIFLLKPWAKNTSE